MKHIFLFALIATVLSVEADELQINGKFFDSSLTEKMPRGWYVLNPKSSETGKTSGIKEENSYALSIVTTQNADTFIYFGGMFEVKEGDVLTVSAEVRGKGNLRFGYFGYTADESYIRTDAGEPQKVSLEFSLLTMSMKILGTEKRKVEKIRVIVMAKSGADVVLRTIKAELMPAQK